MTVSEFTDLCFQTFEKNHMNCTAEQAHSLFLLTERMLSVNKTMNLTAITDKKSVILRHYVDSLTVSSLLPQGATVLDVGCGAGFPTLPLAIFRPDLQITALDGTAKRIRYVQETAQYLQLSNVSAVSARAEELAHEVSYRQQFDIASARAVAGLRVLCELCLPYVKIGGHMIAMKSRSAEEELAESKACIRFCGGTFSETVSCNLTDLDGNVETRELIVIQKSQNTPENIPRHFSKISKKPL